MTIKKIRLYFSWIIPIVLLVVVGGCMTSGPQVSNPIYVGVHSSLDHNFKSLKSNLGQAPQIVALPINWGTLYPEKMIQDNLNSGAITMILWNPEIWEDPDAITYENILTGQWDIYLTNWAKALSQFQYPILIQIAPNFNSNAVSWYYERETIFEETAFSPEQYAQVFQYIVNLMRKQGALNVKWVWGFDSHPQHMNLEKLKKAYPGDDYTDWISIDWQHSNAFNHELSKIITTVAIFGESKLPVMINKVTYSLEEPDASSAAAFLNAHHQIRAIIWNFSTTTDALKLFLKQPIFSASIDDIHQL